MVESPVRGASSAVNLGPGFAVGGERDRVVWGIAFREENPHPADTTNDGTQNLVKEALAKPAKPVAHTRDVLTSVPFQ